MKAQNMDPAAKPKPVRRAPARLTRSTTASEDDAEQALREIVATIGKADQATARQRKKFARKTNEKSSIENERVSDQKHD